MKRLLGCLAAAGISLSTVGTAGATGLGFRSNAVAPKAVANAWVSTATLALVPKATDRGVIAAATPLNLTVALRGDYAGAAAMVKRVYTKGSPYYHHFMTPAQFTSAFSATPAAANAAASYLASFGMKDITINPTRTIITAHTTSAAASRAFNTSLHGYTLADKTGVFSNVTPAQVPASLSSVIAAVGGLNNFKLHTYNHVLKTASGARRKLAKIPPRTFTAGGGTAPIDCNDPTMLWPLGLNSGESIPGAPYCYPGYFTPDAYRFAYDDQGNPTGQNAVIGDITESCPGPKATGTASGDGCLDDVTDDLWEMDRTNGLPTTPVVDREVDPGTTSTDNSGEAEWDIDTQGAAGIAGGVKEMVYYNMGTDTLNDLSNAIAAIAADDKAVTVNASIGACELFFVTSGLTQSTDFSLAEMDLQGQTLTVASGDTGSFCPADVVGVNGVPAGAPDIDYPASSPYALAVGGTSLFANSSNGSYGTEIGWYSSDGGSSLFEQSSPWQSAMIYNDLGQEAGLPYRIVPDVVMNADINSGIYYYQSGAAGEEGGTSLAAPLAEGVWARIASASNNAFGFAGPTLYAAYQNGGGGLLNQEAEADLYWADYCAIPSNPETGTQPANCTPTPPQPPTPSVPTSVAPQLVGPFRDIICCANGYYTAAPGFDFTTGMGSLDINGLFIALGLG